MSGVKLTAHVLRVIKTIEKPFMVVGEHKGRASCWVDLQCGDVVIRAHIKETEYESLKKQGAHAIELRVGERASNVDKFAKA